MLDFVFSGIGKGQAFAIGIAVTAIILWLLSAAARWRMFTKMGEKGWKSFIPFYGIFIEYSRCWCERAAWNYLSCIILSALFEFGAFKTEYEIATIICSIAELVLAVYTLYLTIRINFRVAKAFGFGTGFGFGLWLFPYIFTFILGFGSSEFIGNPPLKSANKQ